MFLQCVATVSCTVQRLTMAVEEANKQKQVLGEETKDLQDRFKKNKSETEALSKELKVFFY